MHRSLPPLASLTRSLTDLRDSQMQRDRGAHGEQHGTVVARGEAVDELRKHVTKLGFDLGVVDVGWMDR